MKKTNIPAEDVRPGMKVWDRGNVSMRGKVLEVTNVARTKISGSPGEFEAFEMVVIQTTHGWADFEPDRMVEIVED